MLHKQKYCKFDPYNYLPILFHIIYFRIVDYISSNIITNIKPLSTLDTTDSEIIFLFFLFSN